LKVLIDTSAWVDFLNGYPSPESQAVAELIANDAEVCTCGVVIAEVFQGLRKDKERSRLSDLFSDLVLLEPAGTAPYFRSADLYRTLRAKGITIRSTIDCLIAILANENGCSILARDSDMDMILDSGILGLDRWPIKRLS
jgi:predicted nucleic acid-binding protein